MCCLQESSDDSESDIPSDLAEEPLFREELAARRAEGSKEKKKQKAGKGRREETEGPDEEEQVRCGLARGGGEVLFVAGTVDCS